MFALTALDTVGIGVHRSGWPYAVRSLKRYVDTTSGKVVLDDFVERTFLSKQFEYLQVQHRTPWVGICHHPPEMPSWYDDRGLRNLDNNPRWQSSLPSLRLVITLAETSTRWVVENWRKPCVTLRHPTAVPGLKWSIARYLQNTNKRLIQVGSFLRNTHAIYQVKVPARFRKTRLVQAANWVIRDRRHRQCGLVFGGRAYVDTVDELWRVGNGEFDRLLSENVVFLELIAAAANNTIVECIARNTPIAVNRLDGPEYYLGRDYPLFYNEIGELLALLTDENIIAAHKYLRNLDKSWIRGGAFASAFLSACKAHIPELST